MSVASPQPGPRPASDPSEEPARGPEPVGRVFSNLLLLSLLGVAASVWVWFYTEWFPVIGSLLGLGGVFTWLAFLSGLLKDERKEQLQELLDRRVFAARGLVTALLAVVVALGLGASLFGAVVVRSTADSRDRTVAVVPAGAGPEDPDRPPRRRHLPPQGERTPGLIRLSDPIPEAMTPIWLLTHRDLRRVARVRVFLDFMAEAISRNRAALGGLAKS